MGGWHVPTRRYRANRARGHGPGIPRSSVSRRLLPPASRVQITSSSPEWVRLVGPEGGASLSFQFESDYVRPVWPQVESEQQMMMHLDIGVEELDSGVAFAESLGATLADYQPQEDVRVMLDPVGHPFCLFA